MEQRRVELHLERGEWVVVGLLPPVWTWGNVHGEVNAGGRRDPRAGSRVRKFERRFAQAREVRRCGDVSTRHRTMNLINAARRQMRAETHESQFGNKDTALLRVRVRARSRHQADKPISMTRRGDEGNHGSA